MAEHSEVDKVSGAVHRRDAARIIRLVVVLALVVAFIAVALDNRADVRVGYAVGEAMAPGWLVIAISAVGGLIIGWLLRLRSRNNRD
ncbi:MAG: LapA family protein [Actinomycetota bacterium]|nr:LapA family protein [Actinomycetota bacterium]